MSISIHRIITVLVDTMYVYNVLDVPNDVDHDQMMYMSSVAVLIGALMVNPL